MNVKLMIWYCFVSGTGVALFVVKLYGFLGYSRVVLPELCIVESKPVIDNSHCQNVPLSHQSLRLLATNSNQERTGVLN